MLEIGLALLRFAMVAALPAAPQVDLAPDALNRSARCGTCHTEIYAMWRRSMHSASYTDPIFQASYLRAYRETGGQAEKICYPCHAPMALSSGDAGMAVEGIGCDYCHSVVSVHPGRAEPMEIRLDGVKRGPLSDSASPAHLVADSPLHETSEFCAGCHEYDTPAGLPIFTTYSEWKTSPQAAEGKTCQSCHMPLTSGSTVRSAFNVNRRQINLHNISGSHSSEQVKRAAEARILRLAVQPPSTAVVEVEVANVGSGHCIPTGLPTRKLILEVILYANGLEVQRFERVYQKRLLDSDGKLITDDHRTILASVKVLDDNRIGPGERRLERFTAPVPARSKLQAVMHLRYSYEPELLIRQPMTIDISTQRAGSPR